jgi:methyltransferase family protein
MATAPPYRFWPPWARGRLAGLFGAAPPALVMSGHVHQYRVLPLDGTEHLWVPTTWAVLPDQAQPVVGVKRCGIVSLAFGTGASPLERAEALQDAYLPISAAAGHLLYALARAIRPETVVEFGTSFGISTIHLAAAVADNGTGHVVTTELSDKKARAAQANLQEAGVSDAVTVLTGDARAAGTPSARFGCSSGGTEASPECCSMPPGR